MAKDALLATSLPGEINAATRTLHTSLNRLITSRLPLALPPHSTTPSAYTTGLLHFAHIYLTFESLWTDLLPSSTSTTSVPTSPLLSFLLVNPYDAPELFSTHMPPTPAMLHFLSHLRPRGLARSGRLKRDLETLMGLHPTDLSVLLAQYPGERVQEFCLRMRRVVSGKPHVLVAYAWCYYMAVFSGGRWIRGGLVKAGEEFWRDTEKEKEKEKGRRVELTERGLSFWYFDGENDGEDIKAEFKRRLAEAEELFTPDERVDVIEEAKAIFRYSALLVEELDEKIGTDEAQLRAVEHAERTRAIDKAKMAAAEGVRPQMSRSGVMWSWSPVTGAVIVLGCLVGATLLRYDSLGGL
ncbi:hypothetical protein BCR34DRAFT_592101 [Clohesyomyces aquaticus]|uniref:Heme oxygenase-like protein n=1 Tax=Clohesyomyces aquaticus TaxID=1231657 RepID=A0A1Y1YVE0_9PLEO|nr:hypothetical protein BCR34DRAFT_592101 [Clohesyomyces aquaticus]